mgnify:CR=1 FL=1
MPPPPRRQVRRVGDAARDAGDVGRGYDYKDASTPYTSAQLRHRYACSTPAPNEAGADTAGGRLRDSTARFFCTPDQLPHRPARTQLLDTDGLVVTKRTSTVIGVGINPSQEIKSIGARENFTESVYAIRRRNAAAERAKEADVAMVAGLR